MSDSISTFFDAWEIEDANIRFKKISSVVTENIQYDDPRTQETLNGIDALNSYVGMFCANAPGWSAKVVRCDTTGSMTRATVVFSGMGPDGSENVQYGQYFVENDGDRISRMVGFVGTGNPE